MEITGQGDFHGLPTAKLGNGALEVEFLTQAGLRLVRLTLAGSDENLLAETPSLSWETPHGRYYLRGGHRLWVAPENPARTSIPDSDGLTVERLPDGLRLLQPAEAPTGLRKSIEILQKPGEPRLILRHELANEGSQPIDLAPWAITMLRPGGVAIVPQPTDSVDPDGLQPNRSLILWPRTRWDDPRLHLGEGFVFVECRPIGRPAKIGTFSWPGWLGYRRGETLFVKRFESKPGAPHTDLGCNAEVYVCDEYLELESLGPLCVLAPGGTVSHTETWEVYQVRAGAPLPEAYTPAWQALQKEPWSAG
jgi:hypothetical protein